MPSSARGERRRSRSVLPRRSPVEWGVRIVLALAAAWLGWMSVTHSLALSLRTNAPARADALAPWDARVAATYSATLAGPEATPAQRAEADEIARAALRRDPTAVAAVATLGINAAIREDTDEARRLFAYSEMLSRRDLRTRLWAIEDAVARDDVPAVLRNYDIALRTSRIAPDLLYPVLSTAIADPAIQVELARTLAARPSWTEPFIGYASETGDPQAVALLFGRLTRTGITISPVARANIVARLVAAGEDELAWRYFATTVNGADRRRSRDPHFLAAVQPPSMFDWLPVQDGNATATIQRDEDGGIVDFFAPATIGGPMLSQRQVLPAGDYVIEGRSAGIEQPLAARPFWQLTCFDGRELGRVTLPNSTEAHGRFSGRVTVPSGCPAQILSLVARPSNEIGGLFGQIREVQVRPAGELAR